MARILCGISAALAFATAPLYIAEVAPSDWRGALGSCVQLACTIGTVCTTLPMPRFLCVFTIHQNSRFLRSLRDSARVSLGRAARARVSCAGRLDDRGDRRVLCVNACARDAAMAPESQAQERRPPRAPLSANQSIRRRGRGASHALHLKPIHISAICIIFIYSVLYEYILARGTSTFCLQCTCTLQQTLIPPINNSGSVHMNIYQ